MDPWKHYSLAGLLSEAVRLYARTLPRSLPLAALILLLSVTTGTAATYIAMRELPSFPVASAVAVGARLATFSILLMTPVGASRALRIAIEQATGCDVRFSGMRRYRLVGTAAYLAIPFGVVAFAFPLGLVGIVFYAMWMFAPHAVLVEADGGRTALRRSRTLFQGEFSATALPGVVVFAALLATLAMTQILVPRPPGGGFVFDEDRAVYVRQLGDDERYDPQTRILTQADGKQATVRGATFDEQTRSLTQPAPPPVPTTTALVWAGVPLVVAGLLDPIRWLTLALLYINLRTRREGLTLSALLAEIDEEANPTATA